jgi:hypothetical protein
MYIAPTLNDARRLMWDKLKRKLAPAIVKTNDTRLELGIKTVDGGESVIFLGSWELVENYRGDEFDFIVPDETQDYRNFWVGWQEALRPTLTPRRGSALFMGTPKGFNHLYDLFQLEKTDPDFHFTSYHNAFPLCGCPSAEGCPHLPVEEIEAARRQLTEDRFAQEYLADFRKVQGLVYKDFDRARHVTSELPKNRVERLLGVDFGFTNPTAVLTIDKDGEGVYWITSEWYKPGKTNIEVVEYAKSQAPNAIYPDPAEPDRIEEMRRHGLNCRDVSKDIEAGISKLQELLRAGRIKVHSSCVNTIAEFESYAYPEKKPDHNEPELPIKENDHAMDALRYALYMNSQAGSGVVPPPVTNLVQPYPGQPGFHAQRPAA